jgi:D-sedoheptulose 7-phosphate isomerase
VARLEFEREVKLDATLPDDECRAAIAAHLRDGAAVRLASIDACTPAIIAAARAIIVSLRAGGKVVFCGNGGSAADAQHLSAELVGRYLRDRDALAAIALTTDTSVLTAVGNDHGYASVFERQVRAIVGPLDTLVAISTSGRSESTVRAATAANEIGATTVGMTGDDPSTLGGLVAISIRVPSTLTPLIQETHLAIGHAICGLVEDAFAVRLVQDASGGVRMRQSVE